MHEHAGIQTAEEVALFLKSADPAVLVSSNPIEIDR